MKNIKELHKTLEEKSKEVAALRKLKEDLIVQSPIGIFTVDKKGWICFANKAFLNLNGNATLAQARHTKTFAHPNYVKSGVARYIKRVLGGRPVAVEYVPFDFPNGKKSYLHLRMVPVRDLAGKVKEALVMVENVSDTIELKKQNQRYAEELEREVRARTRELRKAYGDLKEEIKLKDELFHVTSHELKTPLIPLIGYLQLLEKGKFGKPTSAQKDIFKRIDKNVLRLRRLIDEILDISKLKAKKIVFISHTTQVEKIIQEAVETVKTKADENKVKLKTQLPKKLPEVRADSTRLMQILTNLLDNAVSFTEKGSVTVKVSKRKDELHIDVIDTGVGIPKRYCNKIFEKFFQVENWLTRKHPGVGLGLPICKALAEGMGGSLTLVKSSLGKGSTFRVSLPIKKSKIL